MKKVLVIAYHFPPKGGAGVQRTTKLVRYMPNYGIRPFIVSPTVSKGGEWTPEDSTLEAEIPDGLEILRVPWEKNWSEESSSFSSILEFCRRNEVSSVYVSMSPFTDAALARSLAARLGIPWIADLRDPWALDEFRVVKSFFHRRKEQGVMERELLSASSIILNTHEALKLAAKTFKRWSGKRLFVVTNGYDENDFNQDGFLRKNDKFTIVHTGFFHTELALRQRKWNLVNSLLGRTRSGVNFSGRTPLYLLRALEILKRDYFDDYKLVALMLVGKIRPIERDIISKSTISDIITVTDYVDHATSVRFLKNADLLFLPMHAMADGCRATIVPGKTYEYLASGTPILGAVPEGDAKTFIGRSSSHYLCDPTDTNGILNALRLSISAWRTSSRKIHIPNLWREFERKELCAKISDIITSSNK